ncbi:MAG: cyclase family protein, partial [Bacteroidota bacterium]
KAHENFRVSIEDILDFEKMYGVIPRNSLVIIYTGWSKHWSDAQKYRNNLIFPSITSDAAHLLLDRYIVGLGVDTLGPDIPTHGFPVHKALLNAGKYIIENIANAEKMPPLGGWCIGLPLRIKDAAESPMRLIGLIPKL